MTHVVIVGAGFAGLNAAQGLAGRAGIDVTVIDRQNHHLFQPLLYQVATAGLSPADIAAPVRSVLSRAKNVRVLMAEVGAVDLTNRSVQTDCGEFKGDYLILATGATHAYFGHDDWEPHAPGLKTLPDATAIRARILTAFEAAERSTDPEEQARCLTFVIVGGGPTGVELAGAIAEMSHHTLARDFRHIDPRRAHVLIVEAGPRLLSAFDARLSARSASDLESLGVQVRLGTAVTEVRENAVSIGNEVIAARTIIWAAGVRASPLAATLGVKLDRAGRVEVGADLALPNATNVFVAGDLAHCIDARTQRALPGVALVAKQQGEYIARTIRGDKAGRRREPFRYFDLGQMATIGRRKAVAEMGRFRFAGRLAWWLWLGVHIYRLTGFRNRLSVMLTWAWSYITFGRGARLIVDR